MAYQFERSDSEVGDGLSRIVLEQIDLADAHIEMTGTNGDRAAVHETRKCFKRIRAVLSLVSPGLAQRVRRREDRCFRDLGRRFGEIRDAQVQIALVRKLAANEPALLPFSAVSALAALLSERVGGTVTAPLPQVGDTRRTLGAARARVDDWTRPLVGWRAIGAGLRRVYGEGRRRGAERPDSDESLHEWRKRVKTLSYQVRVLSPSYPEPLELLAQELHDLAERLGDDHDLAVLTSFVLTERESLDEVLDVHALFDAIGGRRCELQRDARDRAERIYAESDGAFAKRMHRYWSAWRKGSIE